MLEAEWGRFQRYHRPLSMLMLDIAHFKGINDCYGHVVSNNDREAVAYLPARKSPGLIARCKPFLLVRAVKRGRWPRFRALSFVNHCLANKLAAHKVFVLTTIAAIIIATQTT